MTICSSAKRRCAARSAKPSIPMALNPEGAYFIGLKIGRRSAELVLIDFLGNVRSMLQHSYRYPAPRGAVEFVTDPAWRRMRDALTPAQHKRFARLGIAMPFELWNWADTAGAPRDVMDEWRHRDIQRRHPACSANFRSIFRTIPHRHAARSSYSARRELPVTSFTSTSAPLPAAASCSMVACSWWPYRQCRCARLHAGAGAGRQADPIDRRGLDRDAGKSAQCTRHVEASHLWTSPEDWGEIGVPNSTNGSPTPRRHWPTPSWRLPQSSISRRR